MRSTISAIGARRPIDPYPGNKPIRKVGIAMAATENVSAARRPKQSPICPMSMPPIGRIR
jgi:hypothetical protein